MNPNVESSPRSDSTTIYCIGKELSIQFMVKINKELGPTRVSKGPLGNAAPETHVGQYQNFECLLIKRLNMFKKQKLDFEIHDDHFVYKSQVFSFLDIKSIRFAQARHDVHYVLVGTSSTHQVSMIIDMKNGEEIKLKEADKLLKNSNDETVDEIRSIYIAISDKTSRQRANAYQEQIKSHGYFHYSGWRLYPEGRYIESDKGKFSLEDFSLFKHYGFLELRPKNPSVFDKLKRKVTSKMIGINTTTDTDVIFPLLEHYFGLTWAS